MDDVPNFLAISHLDLSVTDVERSAIWYCEVLGLRRVRRSDLDNRIMVVLVHDTSGLVIGLNQHNNTVGDRFDEHRPGLDHVGFAVSDRADLVEWEARLSSLDVVHSPVQDSPSGAGAALVFRDPDNIQLEFWWTAR
ncbi:MAG: VOC family protein [Terrimesophilobacter sp.]